MSEQLTDKKQPESIHDLTQESFFVKGTAEEIFPTNMGFKGVLVHGKQYSFSELFYRKEDAISHNETETK